MRKRVTWIALSVLLVLGLVLSIAGCKTAPATAPSPTTTAPPAASPSPAPSPKPSPTATVAPTTKPATPAAPTPAQPAVITLRGQRMYPVAAPIMERFPWNNGLLGTGGFGQLWKQYVEAYSGGRLKMDLAEPAAIVPVADMLTAVGKGTLDFMAHGWAGMWTGVIPEGNVEIGLPYSWENPADLFDGMENWGMRKVFEEVYAEKNVWPYIFANGDTYGFYANFDPTNPQSIKGKKMRAYGTYGNLIQALGGTPATIAGADLYMALKLGTVDGAIYGMSGLWDSKHQEVVKYVVTDPNLTTIGCTFYVNLDTLKKLPDDLRKLLMEGAAYTTSLYVNQYTSGVQYYINQAAAKGLLKKVTWTGADRQYVIEKGVALWDEIAKLSPRTKKLVDMVKAQMREYGKIK